MSIVRFGPSGAVGLNADLSAHELPPNAWTDCNNVRFADGYASVCLGYKEVYPGSPIVPYHLTPTLIDGNRYWVVAGAAKLYCVVGTTYTDLTRSVGGDYTATPNAWTSTLLSGLPILNNGTDDPQSWDLDTANNFVDLPNWPANTTCKSLRAYKNYLIALNITVSGQNYPYMVKWSDSADAGSLPGSWNEADPTVDAGETDVAAEGGEIIDGGQLRDTFIIYKRHGMTRMTFNGSDSIFTFEPFEHTQGILARNCWTEVNGMHFVVTGSDIVLHDGNTVHSVVDKATRRDFFSRIDPQYTDRTFVYRSAFTNEVIVAFCVDGSTYCNKGLIYNYVDKTISYRDLPNLTHANSGLVESSLAGTWADEDGSWEDTSATWNENEYTPDAVRVLMASSAQKIYFADAANNADGVAFSAFMERIGLNFGSPETRKLVRAVIPRIRGTTGETVTISVGASDSPYASPNYDSVSYTIGSDLRAYLIAEGRYVAIKIASGTAQQWTADSLDMDVVTTSEF